MAGTYPDNYPFAWDWDSESRIFKKKFYDLPSNADSLKPDFLTRKPTLKFAPRGEAKQDIFVLTVFNDKNDGFFVYLARNEWIIASNTFNLEYYNNWKGICIEPTPSYIVPILANRKCTLFVNPVTQEDGGKVKFRFVGGYSGVVGEDKDLDMHSKESTDVELSTVTLTTILDFYKAPRIIDYLSLDVEGSEYFCMKGLNFQKYTILVVSIERPKPRLHWLLVKNGYHFLNQVSNWGECFYLHHTLSNFVQIMNTHYQVPVRGWNEESKPYLSHPKWSGVYIPPEQLPEHVQKMMNHASHEAA
jgi:hypothetical protein